MGIMTDVFDVKIVAGNRHADALRTRRRKSTKHLQGQHDQQSHGRGGGGAPGDASGWDKIPQWQRRELENQAGALDDEDKIIVNDYQESGLYDPMNNYLRTGKLEPTEAMADFGGFQGDIDKGWMDQQIEFLDNAVDQSVVPSEMTVYRGVSSGALGDIQKGQLLVDKGFVSTSFNKDVSEEFADGGDLMKIKLNRGDKGLYADPITDLKQRELILPRGSKFRITNVRKEGDRRVVYATVENGGRGAL